MSSRKTMYMGQATPRGGASLMQILAAAKGYNETTGGPTLQTMPDGSQQWTYQPATSKKGFLAPWGTGRARAQELNAEIGGEAFLQQEKGKQEKEQIGLRGEEERKTVSKRGEVDTELEKLRARLQDELGEKAGNRALDLMIKTAKEARETKRKEQAGETMGKMGIINRGPEDEKVAGEALNDPAIRNSLARIKADTDIVTSPEYTAGGKAKAAAPIYENFHTGTINTAPGNISTLPPSNFSDIGNLRRSPQIFGTGQEQTIQPTTKPFSWTSPQGTMSMEMPGEPKVMTKTTPGYTRMPGDPDIFNRAQGIQAPPMSLDNTNIFDFSNMKGVDPILLQQLKQLLESQRILQQQR